MSDPLRQPVFFIGMPRSGTTIVFEAFARHPSLAWLSNYCEWYPRQLWLNRLRGIVDNSLFRAAGRKRQYGSVPLGNRLLPRPHEAYAFWDLHSNRLFSRSFLLDEVCGQAERERLRAAVGKVVRLQGRSRFSSKLTGPPRINYLNSVFPDATFVHIIRNGFAVVRSLMRVDFWKQKGGFDSPFWDGGLEQAALTRWHESGQDPGVLAAVQWKAIIETARLESSILPPGRYHEVRYEEFVASPHDVLRELYLKCGLDDAVDAHEFLDGSGEIRNMNPDPRECYDHQYLATLTNAMEPVASELGYVG